MVFQETASFFSQHEWHQIYHLDRAQKLAGLEGVENLDANGQNEAVKKTVIALTEKYQFEEAVELLFGTGMTENTPLKRLDFVGAEIFEKLWNGRNKDNSEKTKNILIKMAQNFRWSNESEWEGLSIQVYKDEWIIFSEPIGSELICLFLEND